jgi:hypothetical protein
MTFSRFGECPLRPATPRQLSVRALKCGGANFPVRSGRRQEMLPHLAP